MSPADPRSLLHTAARSVREATDLRPLVGVVLGSGLGAFGDALPVSIPYEAIPGMPRSHVPGHAGKLRLGEVRGVPVACLQGRVHLYEGHSAQTVVFGVRLLAELGCRSVLLTNAAGGIDPSLRPGDFLLIFDHLNLTGRNPLAVSELEAMGGPRFIDMGGGERVSPGPHGMPFGPYDARLGACARAAGSELGIELRSGVYAGMLGPSYETPAEIRMLRALGADAVGMSTVMEVIALRQLGVPVGAISCITNLAAGITAVRLDHNEVQEVAKRTSGSFLELLTRWVELAAGLDGLEVAR